jgi:hypothetical protein
MTQWHPDSSFQNRVVAAADLSDTGYRAITEAHPSRPPEYGVTQDGRQELRLWPGSAEAETAISGFTVLGYYLSDEAERLSGENEELRRAVEAGKAAGDDTSSAERILLRNIATVGSHRAHASALSDLRMQLRGRSENIDTAETDQAPTKARRLRRLAGPLMRESAEQLTEGTNAPEPRIDPVRLVGDQIDFAIADLRVAAALPEDSESGQKWAQFLPERGAERLDALVTTLETTRPNPAEIFVREQGPLPPPVS